MTEEPIGHPAEAAGAEEPPDVFQSITMSHKAGVMTIRYARGGRWYEFKGPVKNAKLAQRPAPIEGLVVYNMDFVNFFLTDEGDVDERDTTTGRSAQPGNQTT